jgi:hypothetical protein
MVTNKEDQCEKVKLFFLITKKYTIYIDVSDMSILNSVICGDFDKINLSVQFHNNREIII